MKLFCVGISHHTANVETRERYAGLRSEEALRRAGGCKEALLLTTCNRVEVYASAEQSVATDEVIRVLRDSGAEEGENGGAFYRYEGEACATHLFRVVAGLDSMVIGETEILGQVKKAYEGARESGSAGPLIPRLFQRAFRVAKQVRSTTDITRGAVSVGAVAVELPDITVECVTSALRHNIHVRARGEAELCIGDVILSLELLNGIRRRAHFE